MARRHPVKPCLACGTLLNGYQERFCGSRCANSYNRSQNETSLEIDERMPSDDELWERRHDITWSDISRSHDIQIGTLCNRLRRHGWKKSHNGRQITQAPCAKCGRHFKVGDNAVIRLCGPCQQPLRRTPYMRELRKYMERHPQATPKYGVHELRRVYTKPPNWTEAWTVSAHTVRRRAS